MKLLKTYEKTFSEAKNLFEKMINNLVLQKQWLTRFSSYKRQLYALRPGDNLKMYDVVEGDEHFLN